MGDFEDKIEKLVGQLSEHEKNMSGFLAEMRRSMIDILADLRNSQTVSPMIRQNLLVSHTVSDNDPAAAFRQLRLIEALCKTMEDTVYTEYGVENVAQKTRGKPWTLGQKIFFSYLIEDCGFPSWLIGGKYGVDYKLLDKLLWNGKHGKEVVKITVPEGLFPKPILFQGSSKVALKEWKSLCLSAGISLADLSDDDPCICYRVAEKLAQKRGW